MKERADALLTGYDEMEAAIEASLSTKMEEAQEACEAATERIRSDLRDLEVSKGRLQARMEQEQGKLAEIRNTVAREEAAQREAMAARLEQEEAQCKAEEDRIRSQCHATVAKV